MNYCRAGGWLLLGGGVVLAALSCNGDDDVSQILSPSETEPSVAEPVAQANGCVPGQTLACFGVCGGLTLGHQVCAADGRSYGACSCPEAAPISVLGPDRGGAIVLPPREAVGPSRIDTSGSVSGNGRFGATCEGDADCGAGLNCFDAGTNSLGAGGPAGGYCSTACTTTAQCTAIDRASSCGSLGGRSLCLHSCLSQAPEGGAEKCLDRPDLTCVSSAALGAVDATPEPQLGICAPSCQSDAGCAGRRCDLATGLCNDAPRAGDPIGAACAAPETCAAGICLGATEDGNGFCSAFCRVGVDGCGYDGSEAQIGAACMFPQIPTEGEGDRGLCFELCDVDADCTGVGFTCVPEPTRGRAGVCVPTPPSQPTGPNAETLGLPCDDDDACDDGLTCLTSDSDPFGVGGGPAEGYCSASCSAAGDCPAGAVCATTPGGSFCLKSCEPGPAEECGRDTAACLSLGNGGACLPSCSSDDECGERFCDLSLGLCVAEPSSDPLACTTDDDCDIGVCDADLGLCVLAPNPECTTDDDCDEGVCDTDFGECVLPPSPAPECTTDDDCDEGVCDTDLGECVLESTPACSSDADCAAGVCDLETGECSSEAATCSDDAECGAGVCNVLEASCIDAPPLPIGAACSEDVECTGAAPSEDETRLCLGLGGSNFCSGVCLWGTARGCEAYGTNAFCIFPVDDVLGACLELCDVPSDCEQSGYDCVDIGTVINGRSGACLPPPPGAP